ncbi:Aplysianin-A [Gracilariopsis chorda]|uniref:Aplysianin-A n=1 Tax=Gracilariopsis chorda TaxID=448386 RepID=A0A2V3IDY0_9FLOR|nr:Aplysianin-A [Gracilariopsis chorda]|eukprot:PXF40274.1 Aplysianin-A [Gracilariopsis chorda]
MEVPQLENVDIAVIGAGAAGLYCTYRLLTGLDVDGNPKNVSVAVYEARQRIGGRINSVKLHRNSDAVELGAMRYLPNQKIINSLVENVIAKATDAAATDFEFDSFYHEDGHCLRRPLSFEATESTTQCTSSKNGSRWVGKSIDGILETVVSDVLMADGFSLQELRNDPSKSHQKWNEMTQTLTYRFTGPYENWLLNNMSLDQVLRDQLDKETYEFVRRYDAYDSTYYSSACYGFEVCVEDFTHNTKYRTVKGGLGIAMRYLEDEITRVGGKVCRGHKLHAFVKNRTGASGYKLILDIAPRNTRREVFAQNVILCIPPRGIELLDPSSHLFAKDSSRNGFLRNALDSVRRIPGIKLYLLFKEPWWKNSLGRKARTVTDLPIRQSFYLPSEEKFGLSTVLASYVDMDTCSWWQNWQAKADDGNGNKRSRAYQSSAVRCQEQGYEPANSFVVEELIAQLQQVHSEGVDVSRPVMAVYVDWSWKPGAKGWEVAPFTRRPFLDENIFIAGEAYSDRHGWIEGAFCSAELVIREWFSMRAPEWLDEEEEPYYLGW